VLAGALTYPWSQARAALLERQRFLATAPDELSSVASLGLGDDGRPTLTVLVCWSGDLDEGARVLRPLRRSAGVADDTIGPVDFVDWQRAPDAGYPRGRRHYWKSGYLRHLTEGAVDDLLAVASTIPNPETGIGLQGLRGAASRVPVDATAFPHRATQDDLLILAQWSDPARSDEIVTWARGAHERLRPHLEDAVYVNNLGNEGEDRVRAAYGPNYVRLADLKRRYDPENVFRLNQNVSPGR
jgi:Berberine and berberine like